MAALPNPMGQYGDPDYPELGASAPKTTISLPFTPEDVKNGRLKMTKAKCLDLAKGAVADRGLNYGKPEDNFARIAARWRTHIKNRFGVEVAIDAASVAMMMQDPFTSLTALDSSDVRVYLSPGKRRIEPPSWTIRWASALNRLRYLRKTSLTSAAIGLSMNTGTGRTLPDCVNLPM